MARQLTIYNNLLAPAGYISLKEPAVVDGENRLYKKVWSPIWDIILNKGCDNIIEEDKKEKKNWTWHGIVKNKVYFHVTGDRIDGYFEAQDVPSNKDIFICGPKKKRKKKNESS